MSWLTRTQPTTELPVLRAEVCTACRRDDGAAMVKIPWRSAAIARAHWTHDVALAIEHHVAEWGPATVLRGLAEDRDILALAMGLYGKAAAKQASADRIAEGLRETADHLLASLARRHGLVAS